MVNTATISGNAVGCQSRTQVETECNTHCSYAGITFTSQAQIDAFPSSYLGCSKIWGDIIIQDAVGGDVINDLNPLSQITEIGGSLKIYGNAGLTSLYGLHNITKIESDVDIYNNDALVDFNLGALNTIGGFFWIDDNDALVNLYTTGAITSIGSFLSIINNNMLEGLAILGSLHHIGGNLSIFDNPALGNVEDFGNLYTIGGNLDINNNVALISLGGMSDLDIIGGDVLIHDNALLQGVNGFNALSSCGGDIQIYNNPVLTLISSFAVLPILGGYLSIHDNIAMTTLNAFQNLSTIEGYMTIYNNPLLTEIIEMTNLTQIGGILSLSNNNNLFNIIGLNNINPSTIDYLIINNNPNLAICNLKSVCEFLAINAISASISGNAVGCSNNAEVITSCSCSTSANLLASGPTAICDQTTTTLKVIIDGGTNPFTIKYTDGTNVFVLPNYIKGSVFPVSPSINTTYSLVDVIDAFTCFGTGNTGTPAITVYPYSTISDGNFSAPATWEGGCVPPLPLPTGKTISINHNVVKN